ncbi:hypothetical protein ACFLZN_00425 [Nanoarchaeota archaeon]
MSEWRQTARNVTLCAIVLAAAGCTLPKGIDIEEFNEQTQSTIRTIPEPEGEYNAAILVSPADGWEVIRGPFEWVYEVIIADYLEEKLGVDSYVITFNANYNDLKQVLLDERIQVVVVAGHGSWTHWKASDTEVTEDMLETLAKETKFIPKDWFIRHTCGRNWEDKVRVRRLNERGTERLDQILSQLQLTNFRYIEGETNFSSLLSQKTDEYEIQFFWDYTTERCDARNLWGPFTSTLFTTARANYVYVKETNPELESILSKCNNEGNGFYHYDDSLETEFTQYVGSKVFTMRVEIPISNTPSMEYAMMVSEYVLKLKSLLKRWAEDDETRAKLEKELTERGYEVGYQTTDFLCVPPFYINNSHNETERLLIELDDLMTDAEIVEVRHPGLGASCVKNAYRTRGGKDLQSPCNFMNFPIKPSIAEHDTFYTCSENEKRLVRTVDACFERSK